MQPIIESPIYCPYCGERFEIVIDCTVEAQDYIEDCFVCCQPIRIQFSVDIDGDRHICASMENG